MSKHSLTTGYLDNMAHDSASTGGPNGLPSSPGVISVTEIYSLPEAKIRLAWTDSALRSAKRRGLRLLICGKRKYLAGEEIRRFLESL